ncbi:serine/threonine protein kinase [Epibacterium sp. MM17-32]|uniref:serine/threonine protein kinase n=1 Tax=Epibacterium sp. MM17-32 TaxID=2917734 RepID=UPI001EF45C95|nr:serine/threonine protein kinase [Epibacterium sp. MM17-32]MCG7630485.1 serine/threonine protein kinase [Epibacterium sp. MM17-32]
MSTLPYGRSDSRGWIFASGGSLLAHAAVAALLLGGVQPFLSLPDAEPDGPRYTVTLQPLDSDTLAGLELRDGLAGAEALAESAAEVPPLEPVDTTEDSLSADPGPDPEVLAPEPEPDTPEPVVPETLEPEVVPPDPAPPEAETATPVEAETLEPELETLSPVVADPVPQDSPLSPLIPEDSNPLIPETLSALPASSAETISATPVAPVASGSTLTAAADPQGGLQPVSLVAPETSAAPTAPTGETASAAPARPVASAQDLAVGDLIRQIRNNGGPDCLLTLPRRDGAEGVGLDMMAAQDTAFATFSDTVLTQTDAALRQTRTLLDPRQCPAVDYVRGNRDYPATRLGLRLESRSVASGGRITGVLRGTAGKYVALLLVDNNGVVQDLQRFLSQSGNFTRFDVPVTRAGPQRDTAQMLLAVASPSPLRQIRDRSGRLAADVFSDLPGSLSGRAALAIATFDVR